MDKRTFLKTSSALLTGGLLAPLSSCRPQNAPRTNWAGNLTYSTDRLHVPETVPEAQDIIRQSRKIRPLGSRHSFSTIADSQIGHISLERLNTVLDLDASANTVTVESGMRYGDLCPILHARGYALHNLASLPHISIAGACATATHGSGVANGNLATAVTAIEYINADGELVTLSHDADGETFAGSVVALGGLGLVTKVTLQIEPTYDMVQHVYLGLPLAAMREHFDDIVARGYSVSLFTDWRNDAATQVWVKSKMPHEGLEVEPELFGTNLADRNVHPILALSAIHCTEQMGIPGPWHTRLPHFRMEFTPSSGKELQSEFFVAREHAQDVITALTEMGALLADLLMISEIRTIDADDLWLSPSYGRQSVAFHFTWEQDWNALQVLLPQIEQALEPYEARPHWGKLFAMSRSTLEARYPQMEAFRALVNKQDPTGKFRNAFLDAYV